MYEQHLEHMGLTRDQAQLYEILIKNGPLHALQIKRKTVLSRPMVYKVLDQLTSLGLVEKREREGSVTVFTSAHPLKFKELIECKKEASRNADIALGGILPQLTSDFNFISSKPGIRSTEGVRGVEELFADIINTKQDILLIRSPLDNEVPELSELVDVQIKQQARAGIHTRAITPLAEETPLSILKYDAERLVTRRVVARDKLFIPAQIIIYGKNVGITAYKSGLVTSIINNSDILEMFTLLFEYIWEKSAAEHEVIVATFTKE